MLRRNFAEYGTEVRREREIPALVQLLRLETRPLAVDLVTLHVSANHEQRARMTMVGAAVAVLPYRAAELRHRHDGDVAHAIAKVCHEGCDGLGKVIEAPCELAG